MCNMLTQLGADITHLDEVGKLVPLTITLYSVLTFLSTPLDILADCCIAARWSDNAVLVMLSSLYGKGIAEIIEDHVTSHGFGDIHRVCNKHSLRKLQTVVRCNKGSPWNRGSLWKPQKTEATSYGQRLVEP